MGCNSATSNIYEVRSVTEISIENTLTGNMGLGRRENIFMDEISFDHIHRSSETPIFGRFVFVDGDFEFRPIHNDEVDFYITPETALDIANAIFGADSIETHQFYIQEVEDGQGGFYVITRMPPLESTGWSSNVAICKANGRILSMWTS